MGDWNAAVGEGKDGTTMGPFGLGKRNTRGQRLVDFCKQEEFVIMYTWCRTPLRRRYTWKADYIMVKQRYRNQVKKCMGYPGADADTDHNMVKLQTNLKFRR